MSVEKARIEIENSFIKKFSVRFVLFDLSILIIFFFASFVPFVAENFYFAALFAASLTALNSGLSLVIFHSPFSLTNLILMPFG